jgi:hypothetical protein
MKLILASAVAVMFFSHTVMAQGTGNTDRDTGTCCPNQQETGTVAAPASFSSPTGLSSSNTLSSPAAGSAIGGNDVVPTRKTSVTKEKKKPTAAKIQKVKAKAPATNADQEPVAGTCCPRK